MYNTIHHMRILFVILILPFLSSESKAQIVPIQIEHESGVQIPDTFNPQLESLIDQYFKGDNPKVLVEKTTNLLNSLVSLGLLKTIDLDKNIVNISIIDHNFEKIKKGVNYFIGRGIDNPYQINLHKLPDENNKFYELIFIQNKYKVLSTFTFTKSDDSFEANLAKFAESAVVPIFNFADSRLDAEVEDPFEDIAGITVNKTMFESLAESTNELAREENILPIELINTSMDSIISKSSLSVTDQTYLIDGLKSLEPNKRETFNRSIITTLDSYRYSLNEINFPLGKGFNDMDQSNLTIERAYLEYTDTDAKPFTVTSTISISGKKRISFGLLTGVLLILMTERKVLLRKILLLAKIYPGE